MPLKSNKLRPSAGQATGSKQKTLAAAGKLHPCLVLLAVISTVQLLPFLSNNNQHLVVHCQDFEDLNKNQATAGGLTSINQAAPSSQQQQQPLNRLPQQSSRHSMQRPVLSSRFAPNSGNQQLAVQASTGTSVVSAPPSGSANNIEQLMKNALARNAAIESRQDLSAASAENAPQQQPQPQQPAPARPLPQQAAAPSQPVPSAVGGDKRAEASEAQADSQPATLSDDADKQTTTGSTSGHETVYSDQRFANLFARRSNLKKSKIQPTEQVKAKPTLPSFIKSPPDPKQFSATQAALQETRVATPPSNSFASQRLQQNLNRLNLSNNQPTRKPVITSASAAAANNKRITSSNNSNKPAASSAPAIGSKAAASNQKVTSVTSKPASSNNPFGRQQSPSNDPANVIAMARKRLLANNAIESAKLKQQQLTKPTQ